MYWVWIKKNSKNFFVEFFKVDELEDMIDEVEIE